VIVVATRYDPFRELDRMAERLFSQAMTGGEAIRAMPLDLVKIDEHWELRCDLPGADPGSLDISVEDRVLTIRAQRSAQPEQKTSDWLIQERATGVFARQLTLGQNVDIDHIDADYSDGVLTLRLPVAQAAKPRKIEIAHSAAPKLIEASTN
jgi:HSP20 family protein